MSYIEPRMYNDIAPWFHLITSPEDYIEEATFILEHLGSLIGEGPLERILELGSGGGNTASHLVSRYTVTMVDLSPAMLELSKSITAGATHVLGDMFEVRLGESFDAVFIHDAIMYATTPQQLRAAIETAFVHTRPGGAAAFLPDCVTETFEPNTSCGGHDGEGCAVRYMEWNIPPEEGETAFDVDYVYVIREDGQPPRVEHDRHTVGLFDRQTWLDTLTEVGFTVSSVKDPWERDVFFGVRSPLTTTTTTE